MRSRELRAQRQTENAGCKQVDGTRFWGRRRRRSNVCLFDYYAYGTSEDFSYDKDPTEDHIKADSRGRCRKPVELVVTVGNTDTKAIADISAAVSIISAAVARKLFFFLYWFIWTIQNVTLGCSKTKICTIERYKNIIRWFVRVKKGRGKRIISTPRVSGEYTQLWSRR